MLNVEEQTSGFQVLMMPDYCPIAFYDGPCKLSEMKAEGVFRNTWVVSRRCFEQLWIESTLVQRFDGFKTVKVLNLPRVCNINVLNCVEHFIVKFDSSGVNNAEISEAVS